MIDHSPIPFMPTPTPACLPLTLEREEELRDSIVKEAMSWVGTPYRQLGDVKGPNGAVDCSMLLVRCWVDTGIFEPFDPRPYPASWHLHHSDERYLGWLEALAVEVQRPKKADILACKFGQCFSHGGVMINETRVVHALMAHGSCSATDLNEAFLEYEEKFENTKKKRVWGKRPRKFFDVFAGIRRWEEANR